MDNTMHSDPLYSHYSDAPYEEEIFAQDGHIEDIIAVDFTSA